MGNWIYIVAAVVFALIGWPRGIARSWQLFLNVFVAVLLGVWFAPITYFLFEKTLPSSLAPYRALLSVAVLAGIIYVIESIICWLLNGRNKTPRSEEPEYPYWAEVGGGIVFGALTGLVLSTFLFFCVALSPFRFHWRDPGLIAVERRAAAHLILVSPYQAESTEEAARYIQSLFRDTPMPDEVKKTINERREERLKKEEEEAKLAKRPWTRPELEEPCEPLMTEFHSIWDGAFFIPAIPDLDDWKDERPQPQAAPEEKQSAAKPAASEPADGGPKGEFFQRIRARQNQVVEKANSARMD